MKNYDFNGFLDEKEFEEICCDLIQIRENVDLETFSAGKDGGIDLRGTINNKTVIIQSKKYSTYGTLKTHLKNIEINRVKKLQPERYILIISMGLTPKRKDEILDIFKDYIHTKTDLITGTDIKKYLRSEKYMEVLKYYENKILKNHFGILDNKLLDNCIFTNCDWLYNDIQMLTSYYVDTKKFRESKKMIQKNNVIILTGEPGSGKSTNGKMLIHHLLQEKNIDEVISIKCCSEFFEKYQHNKKQIFFFDDFWGSTFSLNHYFNHNGDEQLLNMIKIIKENPNSFLILTTREYVLRQGLDFYKIFDQSKLKNRIYHGNAEFSNLEKLKILLAHSLNSDLNSETLSMIGYSSKKIINQINYSPRAIAYYFDNYEDTFITSKDFINGLIDYLRNPNSFFKSIFFKLTEGARITAYIISISTPPISLETLRDSFKSIVGVLGLDKVKKSYFNKYVEELENSFTIFFQKDSSIEFKNHSIHDFVILMLQKEMCDYENCFVEGISYFDQYKNLLLDNEFQLSSSSIEVLINRLQENFYDIKISNIDGSGLEIMSDKDNLFSWLYEKIWICLRVCKKNNNNEFLFFLKNEILLLLDFYENNDHYYEDGNIQNIPDIIKLSGELGCDFNYDVCATKYLKGCRYFFEFFCVRFGSIEFQNSCKKIFKLLFSDFTELLENNLEQELLELSNDGISFEYEKTISDIPKILNYFQMKNSKKIQKIIASNIIEYNIDNTVENDVQSLKKEAKLEREEEKISKELEQFNDVLYKKNKITKKQFLNLINSQNFNVVVRKNFEEAINSDKSILSLFNDSSVEYIKFLLKYANSCDDLSLSWDTFPKLVDFIKYNIPNLDVEVLYSYANFILIETNSRLSIKHLLSEYKISRESLDKLVDLGVLYLSYNLVCFTDVLFNIYLSTMSIVNMKVKTRETYEKHFNSKTIISIYDYPMFEHFDTKDFNQKFLIKILDALLLTKETFKREICDIDFKYDLQDQTAEISYKTGYNHIEDIFFSFFGILISNDIIDIFEESEWVKDYFETKKVINVREFINDPLNKNFREYNEVIKLSSEYYDMILLLHEQISLLNDNEKFIVLSDET